MNHSVAIKGIGGISNLGTFSLNKENAYALEKRDFSDRILNVADFNIKEYVSKKRDLNSMSQSQLLATYAAGTTLEDAGKLSEDCDLSNYSIFLSCRTGENSEQVDDNIFAAHQNGKLKLNEELKNLRPTVFLTQLPNLFSANVSIVYGLCGESITFMGENAASINSVNQSIKKLKREPENPVLTGGVFNGDRNQIREFINTPSEAVHDLNVTFGSAASFMLLESMGNADASKDPILTHLPNFDCSKICNFIEDNVIDAVSVSHEMEPKSQLLEDISELDITLINKNDYVGNLFEASLHTQILLTLAISKNTDKPFRKVLILCQAQDRWDNAYLLEIPNSHTHS